MLRFGYLGSDREAKARHLLTAEPGQDGPETLRRKARIKAELQRQRDEQNEKLRSRIKAAAYDKGRQNWRRLFREQDKNFSGGISFEEFTSMCRKVLKLDEPVNDLRQVFNCIDSDRSGECDIEELVHFVSEARDVYTKRSPEPSRAATVGQIQARREMKNNEWIGKTRYELKLLVEEKGGDFVVFFSELDTEGKGTLSFEEIAAMCRTLLNLRMPTHILRIVFNAIDVKLNGQLSQEDLLNFVEYVHPKERAPKVARTKEKVPTPQLPPRFVISAAKEPSESDDEDGASSSS